MHTPFAINLVSYFARMSLNWGRGKLLRGRVHLPRQLLLALAYVHM